MRRWRWGSQDGGDTPPPASPPSPEPDVVLPDVEEAEQAVQDSLAAQERVDELAMDVHDILVFLRSAREENHFAQGIVAMIKAGR